MIQRKGRKVEWDKGNVTMFRYVGHVARMREIRVVFEILVGNSEVKRLLARPDRTCTCVNFNRSFFLKFRKRKEEGIQTSTKLQINLRTEKEENKLPASTAIASLKRSFYTHFMDIWIRNYSERVAEEKISKFL